MKNFLRMTVAILFLVFSIGSTSLHQASATTTWLNRCVTNIDDSLFDSAFVLNLTGYATESQFETAVTNGTWQVQLATGSGLFGINNGNSRDLYCGNSQDNTVYELDSAAGSRDFFIGGAGNDSTTGPVWESTFYGGTGNDYAARLEEASYFYGGPGTDSCGTVSWDSRCLTDGGPTIPVPGTPLTPTAVAGVSSVEVTVAAGSGGTPASYLVTSTPGSFTCTVTGSSGSCTVSGLTNGTSYTFKASATNGGGTSGSSVASSAVTPMVAPVLTIDVQAPTTPVSNSVATGQASVATIVATTSTLVPPTSAAIAGGSPRAVSATTTTTSTTTAPLVTTSTSVSVVEAPNVSRAVPPQVPLLGSGESSVLVGGVATNAAVSRVDNQLVIKVGDGEAVLSAAGRVGAVSPLDSDGSLRLVSGDLIRINLGGFKPASIVEVWMFSTPYNLGRVTVSGNGHISKSFSVPKGISDGEHRIAIVATLANGKSTTVTVGVKVGKISATSATTRLLIGIPISLAILAGALIPTRVRRRRSLESREGGK